MAVRRVIVRSRWLGTPSAARLAISQVIRTGVPQWAGADSVVHLAARVHQMHDAGPGALESYLRVNTDATLALATAGACCGVRRLVYLSTIKVNGEANAGRPFRPGMHRTRRIRTGFPKLRASRAGEYRS